jgi:NADPH:quinone reductase-like Zn-dependent oxidoreductase
VFVIGFLSGSKPTIDVLPIFQKRLNVQGNNTGSISDLEDATRAITAAKIRPIIDRTFDFNDAPSAFEQLAAGGRHFGKLAIRVSE